MKKTLFLFPLLLLLLTACRLEVSARELESRLERIAKNIPSTETSGIALSQLASGKVVAYSATVELTWNEQQGRFSTEKALQKYSREFASGVSQRAPMVSVLTLVWHVPFHSEEEPAMEFYYTRRKSGMTQTDLKDRFTDGTFGADAFIDPNAMVKVPVRRLHPPEESQEESQKEQPKRRTTADESSTETGAESAPDSE